MAVEPVHGPLRLAFNRFIKITIKNKLHDEDDSDGVRGSPVRLGPIVLYFFHFILFRCGLRGIPQFAYRHFTILVYDRFQMIIKIKTCKIFIN